MARLITVVAFAAMLALAFAQNGTTTIAPTATMSPATAMPTMTPTPTPMPTTPPPPVMPPNNTYVLWNKNNMADVCLRMESGIALNYTYKVGQNQTKQFILDFESNTVIDPSSYCDNKTKEAILVLEYAPNGETKDYYLIMNFTGTEGQSNLLWTLSHLMVNFTFDADDFPDFSGTPPPSGQIDTCTNSSLFDETNKNIEYTRSFKCDSQQNITGFKPFTTDMSINLTLQVNFLRVQAFKFQNSTSGDFDDARVCLLDNPNTGNKIVPIAVGAALAGLVIVVLIAYLIGRLRNRRKSSYEALS